MNREPKRFAGGFFRSEHPINKFGKRQYRKNLRRELGKEIDNSLAQGDCPDCNDMGTITYFTHDGGEIEIDCHC